MQEEIDDGPRDTMPEAGMMSGRGPRRRQPITTARRRQLLDFALLLVEKVERCLLNSMVHSILDQS